ncbi:MAG: hypothetical protein OEZ52_05110 [Candidatus Aminicenantes bacterium]|nr:hypothetical protein [Candidatus Aminicenantes bacterium]MDH5742899.1 hypothetical protein [Candidatus Aminicenantes bacterium]
MNNEYQPRQSRATTHFKFYSEKYLWGSTRSELEADERAVWVDFLCLASLNYGDVESYSRDQLAQQLLIERELLDRSIDKFIKFEKVERKYLKREKKEIFSIVKWDHYQADYLKKRERKSSIYREEKRIEKSGEFDAEDQPTLKERRGDDITLQNTISEEIIDNDSEYSSPLAPGCINPLSIPIKPYPEEENDITEKILSMLRELDNYPFIEQVDHDFIEDMMVKYPGIDHLAELEKKIAWWERNPAAVRNNPRKQIAKWFQKEYDFQYGGNDE